jgi:hypothetical protein
VRPAVAGKGAHASGIESRLRGMLFRANPDYDLVLFDLLSASERAALGELGDDPELYGVLRPRRGAELDQRAASRDTALLFLTLRDPGPLPAYVADVAGENYEREVAKLVLDSVLEVEQDGQFVSGPAAAASVEPEAPEAADRIAKLSRRALEYGELLGDVPHELLTLRLYHYGRHPVSPMWKRRLASERAVEDYIGLSRSHSIRQILERGWREVEMEEGSAWRMWHPRGESWGHDRAGRYKLYVSPATQALPGTFATVVDALGGARHGVGLKLGRDVYGLLRPDKLIAYFRTLEALRAEAARLAARLTGTPPHGVPFTAEVTKDGLLSWGIDPPPSSGNGGSWRLWLAGRLAEYLLAARRANANGVEPSRFALERLRLDGVDVETWIPDAKIWGDEGSETWP